jgi:hypothetical protein
LLVKEQSKHCKLSKFKTSNIRYAQKGDLRKAKMYAQKGINKFAQMPIRYRQSSLTKKYIEELKKIISSGTMRS